MTHVAHPYAQRLKILRDWKSRWFFSGKKYQDYLKADILIREYLEKKLRDMYVSSIDVERDEKKIKIIIKTSRAGMIIGRSGDGMKKIKNEIIAFAKKRKLIIPEDMSIDVEEVRYPEADAGIVGSMVVEGLEKRMPFRRVLKMTADKVMASREVMGVRIVISGRLGGAEMARKEEIKKGRVPLQTLRADIDFTRKRANLAYGVIGVKVWIYRGDVFNNKA
ncbi:30S ribosomal protein S3 [Candidatus Campbellbacteria bacterium RIFOXYC2_FULL_35_25]|uniref:Small ribosomal subunit protein uS3 n=1 Tax=Candidatus Campbellbacteria bacterium RIFOXYC2_FULL_35_25 TaxID=1797582 RepID=A0A1F5EIH3_9BACT|nr:MAG: 30S ribosomal protein S3 [Candidatus Campbellbacteria bacterium RIFOXYC2_FULL_35_25]